MKQSFDFSGLSIQERLDLMAALWDSMDRDDQTASLSEAMREELDRRWNGYIAGEMPASDWETVKSRLTQK